MALKKKDENLYLKASKTALLNSQNLFAEAKMLFDKNHYARSFALSAISLEESAKSFLFKLIALDLVHKDKTLSYIHVHKNKYEQASILLSSLFELTNLLTVMLIMYPKLMKSETKFRLPKNFNEKLGEYMKIIKDPKDFEKRKNNALYVGVDEKNVLDPNALFNKNDVLQILNTVKIQIVVVHGLTTMDYTNLADTLKNHSKIFPLLKMNELLKSFPDS